MPPPEGWEGIMFLLHPGVRPSYCTSVRPSVGLSGTSCERDISWTPLRIFMKLLPLIQFQRRMNWLGTQGHGVKGQGHKGMTLKIFWALYLLNPFTDFHETFTICSEPKEGELVRFSRSWGQRSMSYGEDLEHLLGAISPEPLHGFSWNFHHWFSNKGG